MNIEDIKINILINVITGGIFFALGLIWPKLHILLKPLVRWFFGQGVFEERFAVVHGTLIDSRVLSGQANQFRFVKLFRDGRQIQITGPSGNVMGDSEIRAASYLLSGISRFRSKPIRVIDDRSAIEDMNCTFISFGSPSSNEITDIAMREDANEYLEFVQQGNNVFIRDKKTGKQFLGFTGPVRKDIGVILKVPNKRFPGQYFFVCAGLGDWGTSGSAWFLASKWRQLPLSRKGFGAVIEVELQSDSSAKVIFMTK